MSLHWNVIIPSILIIGGWFIVNWLTAKRELRNKKREVRIQYLIEAYRSIASAANRGNATSNDQKLSIEAAIEDIQLLGNSDQIAALNKMIESSNSNFTEILESLRKELRKELALEQVEESLKFYRMERG
jgi:hypothetical protein